MRMIHVLLLAFVVLGAATAARAQGPQPTMVGMPEYGVTLSGSPENPVIENRSGKTIIGYRVGFANSNYETRTIYQITPNSRMPMGIPDGVSVYPAGATPVNPSAPYADCDAAC